MTDLHFGDGLDVHECWCCGGVSQRPTRCEDCADAGCDHFGDDCKSGHTPVLPDGGSMPLSEDNRRGAAFDTERGYRYRLWRHWEVEKPTVAFVMLNPSTADEADDDPTLRRCIGFAKDWGYGGLEVANLFALRATDPNELADHPNPIGGANDQYLKKVCRRADLVVAAWGARGGLQDRASEVAELLDADLHALDTTKAGHPVHPLYQPADAEPEPWSAAELQGGATGDD